jgi:predicted dehydrogenase
MLPRVAPSAAVALIGCGNIGFRHLQALTSGAEPATVTVVEPNVAAHERIAEHIAAIAGSSSKQVTLVTELPESAHAFDLVVVATTTDIRRQVVDALLDRHQVKVLILEKVLFPRVADLDEIGKRVDDLGVATFVNCGRRTFPGYVELRDRLADRAGRSVTVRGNRFGMASNAVHFLDIAEYLTRAAITGVSATGLLPGYVSSKRAGSVEVFGTLTAELSDGSSLTIACFDQDPVSVVVDVEADGLSVSIDELARTVTSDGQTRPFGLQAVSETTWIYDDALRTGTCSLTPYADSARQHRAYFTALRPHLGLSNDADDPCPIS